jgi:pyruvate dehydrogenase E2 component (dihydrolipoamide acetyltransferase)
MPITIDMPKLSDTMTEGILIKWHKKVGDSVEIGDILAEIETDKATMEMEAFDDGTITSILVQEGQKAPIGSVLAILNGTAGAPGPLPVTLPTAAPPTASVTGPQPAGAAAIPAAPAVTTVPTVPVADSSDRVKASPLARKLAEELGVDLATLTGTGPGGRIVKEDVEAATNALPTSVATPIPAAILTPSAEAAAAAALSAAIRSRIAPPAPTPALPPPAPPAIVPVITEADETTPLSNLRKIIASRLTTSKQSIPHFYLHLEADAAPLTSLRRLVNDQTAHSHGNKYSLNDFVLLAVVNAAKTFPGVNSSLSGDSIIRFRHIGLAVAISVDDGLVTPVIKLAETKSLLTISREVKDLATRAKQRKLRPDEFDGGTITVSNLGAWGIESFDAIINPPQAAILSIGAAVEKPVVKDGQVVPGLRMNIGLSCDHRIVDGTLGAQFLAEVKRLIEHPAMMLL